MPQIRYRQIGADPEGSLAAEPGTWVQDRRTGIFYIKSYGFDEYGWDQVGDQGSSIINAGRYNLPTDGVTPADDALLAAHAAMPPGGGLYIPPGEYALAASLDLLGKALTIEAVGVTPISDQSTVARIGGERIADLTSAVGDIARGASSFTVASAAGISEGVLLGVRSSGEVFNDDRPTVHFKGEIVKVASVVGTTINIEGGFQDDYDDDSYTIHVDLYNAVDYVDIDGLGERGDGVTAQSGLIVQGFHRSYLHNVRHQDTIIRGLTALYGRDLTIDGGYSTGCDDPTTGYGVQVGDIDGFEVRGYRGEANRHSIDVGGTIPTRDGTVRGSRATGDLSAGFSSHGNSDNITWLDNTTLWCGGAFIGRGSDHTYRGNKAFGTRATASTYLYPFYFGDNTPNEKGNGRAGRGLRMYDNLADLRGHGITSTAILYVFCTATIEDAEIAGNRFYGNNGTGMSFAGDNNRKLKIHHNVLDLTLVDRANQYGILVVPTTYTTPNSSHDIEIASNNIAGSDVDTDCISAIRVHGAPADDGNDTSGLNWHHNNISGFARAFDLPTNGYFGGSNRIENNIVDADVTTLLSLAVAFHKAYPVLTNNTWGDKRYSIVGDSLSAPTTWVLREGDIVLNNDPDSADPMGWVCIADGANNLVLLAAIQ